jgi:hypothetical protein
MNGRRSNRGKQNIEHVEKKVIRCKFHQKPVFMNETCSHFLSKHKAEGENECKNCQYAF